MPTLLEDGPSGGPRLVLAHGAGAPMDSPFMNALVGALDGRGIHVFRFEFPYMAGRRGGGSRRPPDREAVLLETWRTVARNLSQPGGLFIGGKSMGGRMATMVADELDCRGVVCFGYPFHGPGRPDTPRIAHLQHLVTPALILQGTRDPFGGRAEVPGYALAPGIEVHWLEGGDHDYRTPRGSGSQQELIDQAASLAAHWIARAGP